MNPASVRRPPRRVNRARMPSGANFSILLRPSASHPDPDHTDDHRPPPPDPPPTDTAPDARRPMRRLLPFALAGLLALTLLPGIAAIDVIDWREARDAVVARESLTDETLVTPFYAREALFERPLGGYLHEFVARELRGGRRGPDRADTATSRAVRAALAVALALVVAAVGTRAFGWRAGWLGACALASSVGLPLAARADGGQLLATLCAWLGVGGLFALVRGRERHQLLTRVATWLALAAALLVGGPLPALWPLGGFALYFALARTRQGWRDVQPFAGLAIVIGLALPWYGFMVALYGTRFLAAVPWFPYAAETRGSWFAGPLLAFSYTLVLGFPWIPLLGASLQDAGARLRTPRLEADPHLRHPQRAASLLLALMVVAGVPVALYPGPPLTAALPALPAIALLCGRFLDRVLDGDMDPRHLSSATRFAAFLGTGAGLMAVTLAQALDAAAGPLRLLGAAVFVASWAPLLADFRGQRKLAAALFALPVAIGAPLMNTQVLPAMEPWLNTRAVAEAMSRVSPPDAALVVLGPAPPSLRLLLAHNLVVTADVRTALAADPPYTARDGRVYLAFRPARQHDVVRAAGDSLDIVASTPTFVLARTRPAATR